MVNSTSWPVWRCTLHAAAVEKWILHIISLVQAITMGVVSFALYVIRTTCPLSTLLYGTGGNYGSETDRFSGLTTKESYDLIGCSDSPNKLPSTPRLSLDQCALATDSLDSFPSSMNSLTAKPGDFSNRSRLEFGLRIINSYPIEDLNSQSDEE